ncbi:hypothetical protein CX077_18055 [Salmonella enterica subsp. enterica serovar Typhimurium]|nr:hypothetical protein [Salmonella enterica subsp. enterica serovar Typhimurium]
MDVFIHHRTFRNFVIIRTTARIGRQVFQQQFGCHGRVTGGSGWRDFDTDITIRISGLDFITVTSTKIFGVAAILIAKAHPFHGGFSCRVVGVQVAFRIANRPVHRDLIANVELLIAFGHNFTIAAIDSYRYVIFVGIRSFIRRTGNPRHRTLNGARLFRDNLPLPRFQITVCRHRWRGAIPGNY